MKWILAILLLINVNAIGQVDDTTKYISYPTQYGMKIPRIWAPTTMIMPCGDTTGKRPGKIGAFMTCTCDGKPYRWDGANWRSFAGAAQLNDSSFIVGRDTITVRGTGQNLQQVTRRGNKTTDTAIIAANRTQRILSDTASEPDYEIEVFPDIQGMTNNAPSQMYGMFDWVVANKTAKNIKALLTLGDLTDGNTTLEFSRVDTAFDKIDPLDLPYIAVIGNHDYANPVSGRNSTNFNTYVGESRYAAHSWKGNAFHGKTENYYIKFDVGSAKYLAIGLEFLPTDTALQWAGRVLDSFPDRKAIILTHAYITYFGERSVDTSEYSTNFYSMTNDNTGQKMWDKLIRKHKNIFLVMNGHFINLTNGLDGVGFTKRSTDMGDSGNIVHQIFVNYQRSGSSFNGPNAGQGYFMRMRFSPSTGKVYTSYYSSYLNQYDPLQDSFDLDQPGVEFQSTLAVRGAQVVNGKARFDSTIEISHFPRDRFVTTTYNGKLDTSSFLISDVVKYAKNGLRKDADTVKFGQALAATGDPAALTTNTEIPFNGFDLRFRDVGKGNTGIVKYYKDPSKSISTPFIQFRDQRDSVLANIGADSLENTVFGRYSGKANTTANMCTFVGFSAGMNNTTGFRNTFVGENAGLNNTTGFRNVGVGARALQACTSGNENTVLGTSLAVLTTGSNNIALGYLAAPALTTGNNNIAMGGGGSIPNSLGANSTGNNNVAISPGALSGSGNFSYCLAIGYGAAFTGATGNNSIYLGDSAHLNGSRGVGNIVIGAKSLSVPTNIGDSNIILSPFATSSGASLSNNNNILGANFHTTATGLTNTLVLGSGMTNNVSNVVRLGRADQDVIVGSTGNQADNGFRFQVQGAGYIRDSLKVDNIPNGGSLDSQLVVRNNVIYKVAPTSGSITSINSQTGPAITIQGGIGISTSTSSNTVTINVNTASNALPHTLDKHYTLANNTGTSESDLFSYTVNGAAAILNTDGQSVHFETVGTFNDATATVALQFYFAGTSFGNTGALAVSATGAWRAQGYIIRTSSSTANASVTITCDKLPSASYTFQADISGVDFTGSNVFKVTGQAGGAGGSSNDITQKSWVVTYQPL